MSDASFVHYTGNNAISTRSRQCRTNNALFDNARAHLLNDLLTDLDRLIYAELSIIYLLDCSFLRLALRCFAQYGALTPKPDTSRQVKQPIGLLIGSNLFCLVMHICLSRPSATSFGTAGYLHGSLLIDFVGQRGPTSKLLLVALDLLVLVLQIVCLGVVHVKKRAANKTDPQTGGVEDMQDLEAEERGERRSQDGDVELQNLRGDGTRDDHLEHNDDGAARDDEDEDRIALLEQPCTRASTYLDDSFAAGTISIVDIGLVDVVSRHLSTHHAPQNDSSEPTPLGRRNGLRFQIGNTFWRV